MDDSSITLFIILGLVILALFGVLIFITYLYVTTRNRITNQAQELYNHWREVDIAFIREEQNRLATGDARLRFNQWVAEREKQIREDAITKSQAVTLGKVSEHFIPYLPEFHYSPQDARFIGSPVDFVVFDGLSEGALRQVVFLEIKTGDSALSQRERWVRDVVKSGKVAWEQLKMKGRAGLKGEE